jgi:hypothetical protein
MKPAICLILFVTLIGLSGCKKSTTCATCTEAKSGYTPEDYCSDPASVDLYIDKLKEEGAKVGQSWSCTKH